MIKFNNLSPTSHQKEKINTAIKRVVCSGWYILGKEVSRFETDFARYVKRKHCIGVANGLEALQISLMAIGIGAGDEVITTPLSAAATTLAILAVGAKPVFVDTTDVGQIDTGLVQKAITQKTKAIVPVHLYGIPARVDLLRQICHQRKIFLVEDACQAHGSLLHDKRLGSFGDLAAFSFYPTKNLGALGDGGAIVTNNSRLAKKCREIRDYGQKKKYLHEIYGINSRLDEIQAAILVEKLKFLDRENNIRRKLAARYTKNLANLRQIRLFSQSFLNESNHHLFVIATTKRDQLKDHLGRQGVETQIHYPALIPQQPFFKKLNQKPSKLPHASELVGQILSLPCHPKLSIFEVSQICRLVKKFFNG